MFFSAWRVLLKSAMKAKVSPAAYRRQGERCPPGLACGPPCDHWRCVLINGKKLPVDVLPSSVCTDFEAGNTRGRAIVRAGNFGGLTVLCTVCTDGRYPT